MRDVTVLDHAVVTLNDQGCYSTFADGTTWGAYPHDTPDYTSITRRCGYVDRVRRRHESVANFETVALAPARLRYCREHEVLHHVVGAVFYGGPSPVLWALAHGTEVSPQLAALEEAMVATLQRWVRAGERPIIGGVDWVGLRARCLSLLNG